MTEVLMAICYVAMMALFVYVIVTAKEVKEEEIEPTEIKPEESETSSIVGVSRSKFLSPPPPKPKPKPHPAQIPAEEVPNLFKSSIPQKDEPEMEYEEEDLPERDEVIEMEVYTEDSEPIDEVEPTRPMCMDYMQMDRTITRAVRGTVSINDKELIEQLEGTELFAQMEEKMTTTNLELVKSILNKI